MKRFLCFVVGVLTLSGLSALGSEPHYGFSVFQESFDDSLEKAKEADLSIFVYFYEPDCATYEYMDYQFHRAWVWQFLNERFINVQVDASEEESNGPSLAKKYNINSYPTYLILDHHGKETHRATQAMEGGVFIDTISWLIGETEFPMAEQDAKYEAGERDPDFVQQYLLDARIVLPKNLDIENLHMKAWGEVQDKYMAIAKEYLTSQEPKDLINLQDFSIIKAYSNIVDDPGIKLVLDHFDAFVETTSMKQVSETLLEVALNTVLIRAIDEIKPVGGGLELLEDFQLFEELPLKKATDWLRSIDADSLLKLEEYSLFYVRQFLIETEAASPDSEE
ncbi:MAG: hypothetical protein F4227_09155 [Gammaproteobacteria bacterium]|nr:hypothetical protein [Gammaproteobacteria bacterium]MYF03118.1 hypothetical protein [Gammaproteobacteria bacterium]MYI77598.1 hypothetical protein [Gammaproteobacteria bacterium]